MDFELINKGVNIYFGAGGAGIAYCKHSKILPDFFVDNDNTKWGSFLCGIEIKNPTFLNTILVKRVVITSGYVKEIMPQLLNLGIDKNKIYITPKSHLGTHIFNQKINRIEAAKKLYYIIEKFDHKWKIVSVGGTALGFARDRDFIHWDVDIDLFAPEESRSELFDLLKNLKYNPIIENNSLRANIFLKNGTQIPLGIDFFDSNAETFLDRFEDYHWIWPTTMFTECENINVHGNFLNIPNPINKYLTGVYGKNWNTPNPEFNYTDYAGKSS